MERFDDGIKASPETAKRLTEHQSSDAFREEYGTAKPKDRNLPFPLPLPNPRPRPFTLDEIMERGSMAIDSIEKLMEDKSKEQNVRDLEKSKPRLTPHGEKEHPRQKETQPKDVKGSSKLHSMRNLFLPLEDILK